jgi:hypothetical protein
MRLTKAIKHPVVAKIIAQMVARRLVGGKACGWYTVNSACMYCFQCLTWPSVALLASPERAVLKRAQTIRSVPGHVGTKRCDQ